MSTRARIAIHSKGEYRHMYHHCDGYPDGVGSELSSILSEYDELLKKTNDQEWKPEYLEDFIVNFDASYRPVEHSVKWDEEYVYIINCDKKILNGYYKGITGDSEEFDLEYPGDALYIPNNKFTGEGKEIPATKSQFNWDEYRYQMAGSFVIASLGRQGMSESDEVMQLIVKKSIEYADTLIKELKKNG